MNDELRKAIEGERDRGCCYFCEQNACEWCPGVTSDAVADILHRWFDQVINTCGSDHVQQVHDEHERLCAALAALRAKADAADRVRGLCADALDRAYASDADVLVSDVLEALDGDQP